MKTQVRWLWSLGLLLVGLTLNRSDARQANDEPGSTPPAPAQQGSADTAVQPASGQPAAASAQSPALDLADATFQPMSTDKPLPPNVKPSGAVAEVIRLVESGVDEGVILAYITNSLSAFKLTPDDIIYLNDIGVPSALVSAMMQRDQSLKGLPPEAAPAVAATPPAPAPSSAYAPVPAGPAPDSMQPPGPQAPQEMAPDMAPPPDYGPADSSLQPPDDDGYANFYNALAPYGTWVDVDGYGPCWQPFIVVANPSWQPYCNGGHWVYTDSGWYWLSGYSWGWAAFHYGRWFQHSRLGWCWAPDTVWGPSWVCWKYGTSYCAWAPLPPGAWSRPGIGLTYRGRPVGVSFGFGLTARSFAVVSFNHFWDKHLTRYALPRQQAVQALKTTSVTASVMTSHNQVINNGLSPARVAASSGQPARRLILRDTNTPSPGARAERLEPGGTSLAVFRPNLSGQAGAPGATGWVGANPGNNHTIVTEITPGHGALGTASGQPAPGQPYSYSAQRNLPATPNSAWPRAELHQGQQVPPAILQELERRAGPAWTPPPAAVEHHYQAPGVVHPAPEPPHTYSPPPAPAPSAPARSGNEKNGR